MTVDALRLVRLAFAAADLLIELADDEQVTIGVGGAAALLGDASLKGLGSRDLIASEDQNLVCAFHQDLEQGQRHGPVLVRLAHPDGIGFAELTVRHLPDGGARAACWRPQLRRAGG